MQAAKIENMAKMKELKVGDKKSWNNQAMKKSEKVASIYLNSIKAKLAALENIS